MEVIKQNNWLLTSVTILTRWYAGSRYIKEIGITPSEYTVEFTWIGGDAYTAPVLALKNSSYTLWFNLLRDYLGNITHVVTSGGSVANEFSYDAWGRRRDKDNWSYTLSGEPNLLAGRGFTAHEFLSWFNLYNMNGRMYDPIVGRFLSPDNYVQMPDFSQSYNRYSYCLNNPLAYTDPSGEKFSFWHLLAGSVFGAASWSGIMNHANGQATIGQAIGEYFINVATFFASAGAAQLGTSIGVSGVFPGMAYGAASGAVIGGASGGLNSSLYGGSFWDGAGKGALNGAAWGAPFGGISGGFDAYGKGNNVWWGTESGNWGYNRSQWSLAWWDKPDVAHSPINSVAGNFSKGCVPTGMESIADSYGLNNQDQYFWRAEYENYTGQTFNGVNPNQIDGFVESVNGWNVDNIVRDDIFNTLQNSRRVGVGINNYGINGGGHFMVVKTMKVWPNSNFKLILMNPDGGGYYRINQRNFFNYGARFWSIFR